MLLLLCSFLLLLLVYLGLRRLFPTLSQAIQSLVDAGVAADRIIFLNVIACPEGLANLAAAFPAVRVLTAMVDEGMDEEKYIVPGLGDYGDRFFNTV